METLVETVRDDAVKKRLASALTPGRKRKLMAAEKRAKKEGQKSDQWVPINGKQVRIKRSEIVGGLFVEEFIARNADPI